MAHPEELLDTLEYIDDILEWVRHLAAEVIFEVKAEKRRLRRHAMTAKTKGPTRMKEAKKPTAKPAPKKGATSKGGKK